jgi:hypothetical protein
LDRFTVELRAEVAGDVLRGHAAVFDQLADLPSHYESVAPGAFDAVLASDPDVRALVNHDPSQLLGRTPNTLRLSTDTTGLAFEVDLPDTRPAHDLRALMARGDISGASFGFVPGETAWSRAPDGRQIQTHTSVARLLDVSVVTFPAYEGAGAALRALTSYTFDRPVDRIRRSQMLTARWRALHARRRAD